MTERKYIKQFIKKLNTDPAVAVNFRHQLSYWWANILIARFSIDKEDKVEIIFNPKEKMFAAIVNGEPFDPHGPIPASAIDEYMGWDAYAADYPEEANEVLRTQIYLMNKTDWKEFIKRFQTNNQ